MTMSRRNVSVLAVIVTAVLALAPTAFGQGQWTIATADGKSSLGIGFLSQLQYEGIDNADASHTQQNLFFRRLRLMLGGKINDKLTFFFDTDDPNLGKGQTTGSKVDTTMYIQDFFLTYTVSNAFKIDGGMLLVPVSHNSQQGATTLLALDYGPFTFQHSTPLNSNVGRDYGIQARGYVADNHVEYRALLLQGNRLTTAQNPLRETFRLVYYPFDADTGFFYTGTFFGKKKIVAIGATYDMQQQYKSYSGDFVVDVPVGKNAFTAQFDYTKFDGGATFKTLPQEDQYLGEAGFYFSSIKLEPFVQYAKLTYATETPTYLNQNKLMAGFIWWGNGHKFNIKVAAAQIKKDLTPDRKQFVVQWQVLAW
jgi:hypothetical protein